MLPDVDETGYDEWHNQLFNEEADRKIHGLGLTQQANDRMADLSRIGAWAATEYASSPPVAEAQPVGGPPPEAPAVPVAEVAPPTPPLQAPTEPPGPAPAVASVAPAAAPPVPGRGATPSPPPSPASPDWENQVFGQALGAVSRAGGDAQAFADRFGQSLSGAQDVQSIYGQALGAASAAGADVQAFANTFQPPERPAAPPTPIAPSGVSPVTGGGPLQDFARQSAIKAGVDPDIFTRQIQQESGFNPNARSPAGATGVAQFMPATAQGMGIDPTDPYQSLDAGARLMRQNLDKYGGDYAKALAAYNCFDDQTEVLTRYQHKDGSHGPIIWKFFAELKSHDEVASYNLRSGEITFRRSKERQAYEYEGELWHFTARGVDCRVTPNHRMLVSTHGRWRPRLCEAQYTGRASCLMVSAGGHDREYPLTDDELRVAAWVLTDGTINQSTRSKRVLIYQRVGKARLVKEILDRLGWSYSVRVVLSKVLAIGGRTLKRTPEPMLHMRLRAESRDRLFEFLPHKVGLPDWVFLLSQRQFSVFLGSFVDGDGSRHQKAVNHCQITGSPRMMAQLQIAAVMNGCRASIYRPKQRDYVRLNVVIDQRYTKPKVTREFYRGQIFCVTAANGTVVTRRNGCVVITGNSGPGNVDKYGGVPPFEETQRYVSTILGGAGQKIREVAGAAKPDWLRVAESQLGKPYIWGSGSGAGGRGTSDIDPATGQPVGFDCSGFVSYVYQNALGINLPAQTASAYDATKPISPSQAQPGDVVLYNMGNPDPHEQHIAIYLGDGKIIQSGGGVQRNVNIGDLGGPGSFEFRRATGAETALGNSKASYTVADHLDPSTAPPEGAAPGKVFDSMRQDMATTLQQGIIEPLRGALSLESTPEPRDLAAAQLDLSGMRAAQVGESQPLTAPSPAQPEQSGQNVWDRVGSGIADVFRNAFSPSGGPMTSAMQPTPSDTLTNPLGTGNAPSQAGLPQPSEPGLPVRQDIRDIAQEPQPSILDRAASTAGDWLKEPEEIAATRAQAANPEFRRQQLQEAQAGGIAGDQFPLVANLAGEADTRVGEAFADVTIEQAKAQGWQPSPDQERVTRAVLSQVTPINILGAATAGGPLGAGGRAAARYLAESALGFGLNIAGTTVAGELAANADLPAPVQFGAGYVGGALAQLTGHGAISATGRAANWLGTPEGQAVLRTKQRAQFSLDPEGAARAEQAAADYVASGPVTGEGLLETVLTRLDQYPEETAGPLRQAAAELRKQAPASDVARTVQKWMEENPAPPRGGEAPISTTAAEFPGGQEQPPGPPVGTEAAAPVPPEPTGAEPAPRTAPLSPEEISSRAAGDTATAQDLSRRVTWDDVAELRRQELEAEVPPPPPPPGPDAPLAEQQDFQRGEGKWAQPEQPRASKTQRVINFMSSNMLLGPHGLLVNAASQTEQLARAPVIRALAGYPGEAWTGLRMLAAASGDGLRNAEDVLARGTVTNPVEALTHAPIGPEAPGIRVNAATDEIYRNWGRAMGSGMEAAAVVNENPTRPKTEVLQENIGRINEAGRKAGATSVFADGPNDSLGAQTAGLRTRLIEDPDPWKKAQGWALYAAVPFSRIPEQIWKYGISRSPGLNEVIGSAKFAKAVRAGDWRQARLVAAETMLDSTINLAIMNQAQAGNITGANDPEHPWSVRLPGDVWLDYRTLGPVATRMGALASVVEATREQANDLKPNALVDILDKVGSMTINQWMLGPTVGVLDLIRTGHASQAGTKFMSQFGDRLVPGGALANYIEKSTDPVLRDPSKEFPQALWERQESRTPGLAGQLPEQISTTTGEAEPNPSASAEGDWLRGLGQTFIGLKRETSDEAQAELARLHRPPLNYSLNPPPIDTNKIEIAGSEVPLDEAEQRVYLAARGKFMAEQTAFMHSADYQGWDNDAKARYWQHVLSTSSDAARAKMIDYWGGSDSPAFQAKLARGHRIVGRLSPTTPEPSSPTPVSRRRSP